VGKQTKKLHEEMCVSQSLVHTNNWLHHCMY